MPIKHRFEYRILFQSLIKSLHTCLTQTPTNKYTNTHTHTQTYTQRIHYKLICKTFYMNTYIIFLRNYVSGDPLADLNIFSLRRERTVLNASQQNIDIFERHAILWKQQYIR